MNRSSLNFLIDAAAFVVFLFLTTTGILTRYVLPPGSGRWATLWGLDRHGWGDVHFWLAVALLAILALHLALHWRWVVCMVRGQHSQSSGARVAKRASLQNAVSVRRGARIVSLLTPGRRKPESAATRSWRRHASPAQGRWPCGLIPSLNWQPEPQARARARAGRVTINISSLPRVGWKPKWR